MKYKDHILSLGPYNPERFTLIYGVFVGPPGLDLKTKRPSSVHLRHVDFQNARLSVLWTFLGVPAHNSGTTCYLDNYSYDTPEKIESTEGLTDQQAVLTFMAQSFKLTDGMLESLTPEIGRQDVMFLKAIAGYFPDGSLTEQVIWPAKDSIPYNFGPMKQAKEPHS
jgi:hypothetical protein